MERKTAVILLIVIFLLVGGSIGGYNWYLESKFKASYNMNFAECMRTSSRDYSMIKAIKLKDESLCVDAGERVKFCRAAIAGDVSFCDNEEDVQFCRMFVGKDPNLCNGDKFCLAVTWQKPELCPVDEVVNEECRLFAGLEYELLAPNAEECEDVSKSEAALSLGKLRFCRRLSDKYRSFCEATLRKSVPLVD